MTVTTSGATDTRELALTWLHCNECHRSFEHHNRLAEDGVEGLRLMRSDLIFSFSSCGHFFCDTCIQQHTIGGKFICTICHHEATTYKIDHHVPKSLQMYLKTPINHLEDSISVMTFQITNANMLIKNLRSKVVQQKDLISKAKQELTSHKLLKEKLNELQQENERLRKRLDDVSKAAGNATPVHPMIAKLNTPTPTPAIHTQGRLTLRSPVANLKFDSHPHTLPPPLVVPSSASPIAHHSIPWPRSPALQGYYSRDGRERNWDTPQRSVINDGLQLAPPDSARMAQPIYATPDNRPRSHSSTNPMIYVRGQPDSRILASPRPVYRQSYHHRQTMDREHGDNTLLRAEHFGN